MPLELNIIRASEFIRLNTEELLDFEASKQALDTLARGCRKRGLDHALLDVRAIPVPPKPKFNPTELAALVRSFQEAGFSRHQRLAVLYREDVYGGVRNFAFFSRMRGLRVRAFTDFEAALQWLSEGEDESPDGAVHVPITQRQREQKKLRMAPPGARRSDARTVRAVRRSPDGL